MSVSVWLHQINYSPLDGFFMEHGMVSMEPVLYYTWSCMNKLLVCWRLQTCKHVRL